MLSQLNTFYKDIILCPQVQLTLELLKVKVSVTLNFELTFVNWILIMLAN